MGGPDSAFVSSSTAAELKFNRNPAIDEAADCLAAPRRNFEADSASPWQRAPPLDHVEVAAVRAAWHESWPPPAAGTTRRRPHFRLVLLYGYQNKEFFHGHINTQTIFKFPDKLIGRRAPTTTVPPRTSAIQQQSCSSQEMQPSTWLRIASLHLAETLRPTALPHDSTLHL